MLIGLAGVAIMTMTVRFSTGISFDTRSILISLSGAFFGFIPTVIAVVITSIYRIIQGGVGTITGVSVIILTAAVGLLWRHFRFKVIRKKKIGRILELYLFGLATHVVMLLCMFILPWETAINVLKGIALPVIIIYPIGELLLGLLLFIQYDKKRTLIESQRNEKIIKKAESSAQIGWFSIDWKKHQGRCSDNLYKLFELEPSKKPNYDEFIRCVDKADRARVEEHVRISLDNKTPIDIEFKVNKKGGKSVYLSCTAETIYDKNNNKIETTGIFRDITNRINIENEKRRIAASHIEQQRLESVGILASGVAHEINNPINGVINYGQLILDSPDTDRQTKEYAGEIISESERIAVIVKNLLQFSRQDKQMHSHAKVEDLIGKPLSLIKTIIKREQIQLAESIPKGLPTIKCRSNQIQQVIMNLLNNARDSLNQKYPGFHENKIINIKVSEFKEDTKRWLKIMIEDHGTGIGEDIQANIFDPFFTTKTVERGTGLGLSISYGIIKEHHGELTFETDIGNYTRFYITLPIDNGWELI